MILSNMLWVPKEQIASPNTFKANLTVTSKYENKESIRTYLETDNYFGLPRNYGIIPKEANDCRVNPTKQDFEFTGKLRPVQEGMIEDWHKFRKQGIDDWVIKGDTGIGKTVIMLKIACELKVPFLVIVPLERLMQQWIDQIKKFTTIAEVGVIQQNRCEYTTTASVGMVHSLCKDKYPDEMKKHFGLIIYDELHTLGAEQFSKVAPMFPAKHRCGASATLKRLDGMENVYFYHLSKNIISTERKTQPKPTIFKFEYQEKSGTLPHWLNIYDRIKVRAFLLSLMANNTDRNAIIAYFADVLIKKGLQTLVIGDRISQLEEIQEMLIEKGHDDTGLYIGKTPHKEKKRIEKEASCILATKKMLEIGIDIDTLRGLIFATPSSNVTQVVGRIRRINPAVPDPVVIDIVDEKHKEAKIWYQSRYKWYTEEGFKVKKITS
jgi:superfamily II DNA or RNA helicase